MVLFTSNKKQPNTIDSCPAETSISYLHNNLNKNNTQKGFTKSFLSAFILSLLLLASSYSAQAALRYSVASGNWNATTTWSATSGGTAGASVPVAADDVTISGGFNVTLTANAACKSITFTTTTATSLTLAGFQLDVSGAITIPCSGAGINLIDVGSGTLNAASIAFTSSGGTKRHEITISTGTVNVTGSITVNGTQTSATITFTGAGFLKVGGTLLYNSTTKTGTLTTVSGSTVEYKFAGNQACRPDTYLGNLTLSGSGTKTFASTPTVNGVLSMEGTATVSVTSGVVTYGAAATLQYNTSSSRSTSTEEWPSTFTATTGGVIIANTGVIALDANKTLATNSVPLTIKAGATLNLGRRNLGTSLLNMEEGGASINATTGSTPGTLTLGGNVVVNNTGASPGATISCNIALDATRTFTVAQANITTDFNITGVLSGSFGIIKAGAGKMQLSGLNTYTGSTTIDAGTLILNSASALGTNAGGTTVATGAELNLNGQSVDAGTLTINGSGIGDGAVFNSVTSTTSTYTGAIILGAASSIGGEGATVLLGGGISGSFALTKGGTGTLNLGSSAASPSDIIISDGTLISTSGTLSISGAFSNSGTFTHNNGTVDFNGGAQSIGSTGSAGTDFYNLTISGTLTKTLTKPVTVAGNLTLTSGFLATDATNILTIAAGGTTSGVSSSSFVNGPMAKAGNTAFEFPVGAGTKLGRIGISAPSTTTTFTAQYFNAAPSNSTSFGAGLNGGAGKISAVEYWNLTPTGTPTANVVLHWESNTSGITSLLAANLVVAHYTGSAWVSEGNAGTTVSGAAGTLTSNTISTWSPFTFGSPSGFAPLPVKLISFTAKAIEKDAILNWSTATERNNDHFELERSRDGVIFTKIGEVNGAGNSTSIVKYAFTDTRVADMSSQNVYYRLKQVDFDGSFEYSNLAIVTFAKQGVVSISNVQPNPFAGNLVVNYNLPDQGNVTIRIIDAQGRIVASNDVNANKGTNTAAFNTTDYAKGIYFISINYKGSSTNYKMLVKE